MTKVTNQLWEQISLDLQEEVGQARWMSTFAQTQLELIDEPGGSDNGAGNKSDAEGAAKAVAKTAAKTAAKGNRSGQTELAQPELSDQELAETEAAPGLSEEHPDDGAHKSGLSFQLVAPNQLTRDNINQQHLGHIKQLISKHTQVPDDEIDIHVQVKPANEAMYSMTHINAIDVLPPPPAAASASMHAAGTATAAATMTAPGSSSSSPSSNSRHPEPPGPSDTHTSDTTNPNSRFQFNNFIAGTNNRFAYQATLAVAEQPGENYNPLFIYGNVGLGKTHLLKAAYNYITYYYPEKRTCYVPTETFLNDFLTALRRKQGHAFREKYRQVDVLILDDIQVLEGKESTQEEIFHTFNFLYEKRKQLIFSSDRPPDALTTLQERLRSRFKSGLTTDIQPPDIETRLLILGQNVKRHNESLRARGRHMAHIPGEILYFIAENVVENVRVLEGALTKVLAHCELMQVSPTLESVSDLLADVIAHNPAQLPTAESIIQLATEVFDVTAAQLTGTSRTKPLATARHITMYAIREHTDLSFPAIGEYFSGRDHTSVMHAYKKVKEQMKSNGEIFRKVQSLTTAITGMRKAA